MRLVAPQDTAVRPAVPDTTADGELVIDLRDQVDGPVSVRAPVPQLTASASGRTLRALFVVVAAALAVGALLVSWPTASTPERVTEPDPTTTVPAPAAEDPPAPAPAPAPAAVEPDPAPTPPVTAAAPRPTPPVPVASPPPTAAPAPPVIVVERSTSTIEMFLSEDDPSANSATMAVGPSSGVDRVRLELLADVPADGTRVPVQAEITNDEDHAIDFPDSITVTVIGERDGQRVAEAVLRLPGVTRLAAHSSQVLTGHIDLTYGTTMLWAEVPMEKPAS